MAITKRLLIHLFLFGSLFITTASIAQTESETSEYLKRRHLFGLTYSNVLENTIHDFRGNTAGYYKGFEIGFTYEYLLNRRFSMVSGLRYRSTETTYFDVSSRRHSIQIPIGFRYYFLSVGRKLRAYTELTGNLNFNETYNRFGAGLSVGATYDITKRIRLSTDIGTTYDDIGGFRLRHNFGLQLKF